MSKFSFMILGALAGSAVAVAALNKDMIEKKMRMMQKESRKAINKVKQML